MREPPERRDGLDLVVAQTLLVAAAALVTAPALVIAVPLALAIDRRGWRRWPALVIGGAMTAGAVAAGALDAYLATWHQAWLTARHGVSDVCPPICPSALDAVGGTLEKKNIIAITSPRSSVG